MSMAALTQIVEADKERDRKTCISLDLKVEGANRELAQWLIDHPRYPASVIAEWLNCGPTRIKDLRRWAKEGFGKTPSEQRRERDDGRRAGDAPLKSQDNSEEGIDEETGVSKSQAARDLKTSQNGTEMSQNGTPEFSELEQSKKREEALRAAGIFKPPSACHQEAEDQELKASTQ